MNEGTNFELAPVEFVSPVSLLKGMDADSKGFLFDVCVKGKDVAQLSHKKQDMILGVFLHRCRKLGLDPFSGQLVCVVRKGEPAYQTTYEGYNAIAVRQGDMVSIETEFDREKDTKHPSWCKATVTRRTPAGEMTRHFKAYWDEWNKVSDEAGRSGAKFWTLRPWHMLELRAKARAIREAYPNELAGIGLESRDDDKAPATKDIPARVVDAPAKEAESRPTIPSGSSDYAPAFR